MVLAAENKTFNSSLVKSRFLRKLFKKLKLSGGSTPEANFFINPYRFVGYDADALLYFAQLSTQPSTAFKVAVNTLILTLKADGNWTHIERLWIHAAEIQQHARVSVVNPSSTQITEVNSPDWVADLGYKGNGTTSYINTEFTPSTATKFLLNDACLGAYIKVKSTTSGADGGYSGGGEVDWFTQVNFTVGINAGASDSSGVTYGAGYFSALRANSTSIDIYHNGAFKINKSRTSTSRPPVKMYFGARNQVGTAGTFNNARFAITLFGNSSVNQGTLYTALQTFATSRGFNV